MDILTLEIFLDTMRLGSFAAVARLRDLDPSSISRTIAGLETELDFKLFQRTTRRLQPTEAGQLYYDRIAPALSDLKNAQSMAADIVASPHGTLRVTSSVTFGQTCVVPTLSRLAPLYPNLTIELLLTDAVVDIVAERIDLALRLGPALPDSRLITQKLMPTFYIVCASPGYITSFGKPRSPSQLRDHRALLFDLPGFKTEWRFRSAKGAITTVAIKGNIVISNASALRQCALKGLGVALLPHWLIHEDLMQGKLVDLFPSHDVAATDFDTAVWMIHPSRTYVPLKLRVFQAALRDALRPISFPSRSEWRKKESPSSPN